MSENRLAEMRKAKGLSQAQLGQICSVNQGAVSQWENNTTVPSYTSASILADFFGVSIRDIFGDRADRIRKNDDQLSQYINHFRSVSERIILPSDRRTAGITNMHMSPTLIMGDYCIFTGTDHFQNGAISLIGIGEDEGQTKGEQCIARPYVRPDGSLILVFDNPRCHPRYFSQDDIMRMKVRPLGVLESLQRTFISETGKE